MQDGVASKWKGRELAVEDAEGMRRTATTKTWHAAEGRDGRQEVAQGSQGVSVVP